MPAAETFASPSAVEDRMACADDGKTPSEEWRRAQITLSTVEPRVENIDRLVCGPVSCGVLQGGYCNPSTCCTA